MLKIKVVSHYGETFQTQMTVEFGSRGGAIGRQDDCLLPLPDPQRHVSRKHAHISWDGANYLIQNVSANNFVIVSGRTLNVNEAVPLKLGQQIYIGHYLLEVVDLEEGTHRAALSMSSVPSAPPVEAANPVFTGSDPLASAAPFAETPAAPQPAQREQAPTAAANLDILGLGDLANHAGDDPFAVLSMPSSQTAMPDDPLFNPAELGIARIEPVNRAEISAEPFSLPSLGARNAPDTLLAPTGTLGNNEQSITDLVGKTKGIDELYPDTGYLLPSDDILSTDTREVNSLVTLEPRASLDPMELFSEQAGAVSSLLDFAPSKTVDDHASSLVMHMEMPRSILPEAESHSTTLPPVEHVPLPDNLFLDLFPAPPKETVAEQSTATASQAHSTPPQNTAADTLSAANEASVLSTPVANAPPTETAEKHTTANAESTHTTTEQAANTGHAQRRKDDNGTGALSAEAHRALIQAFLKGARLPEDSIPNQLTPEFMHTVGAMLFSCMQGTVDLIAARAATKREVNAEMTLIVPVHNNPLKFVPDGRAALIHMFGKQIPGFLGPIAAMEDAYKDLRAHQVGVFAGMRAALAEVLQRFSPEKVEKRLSQHSMLDHVLPAHRKSKLWDLYSQQFNRIYTEAQEDFDIIFGDAFAVAYEEQAKSARETYEAHGDQ